MFAHQSNPNKIESTVYGVTILSHYLQVKEVFESFREDDAAVENLVELIVKLQNEVPLLSGMGIKFAGKMKVKTTE